MVHDLVIHVGLVERGTGERLQRGKVLVAARPDRTARLVLLRRQSELLCKRHGLLVDTLVSRSPSAAQTLSPLRCPRSRASLPASTST